MIERNTLISELILSVKIATISCNRPFPLREIASNKTILSKGLIICIIWHDSIAKPPAYISMLLLASHTFNDYTNFYSYFISWNLSLLKYYSVSHLINYLVIFAITRHYYM